MKSFKENVQEIKDSLDANQIKTKIESDLSLTEKNKKYKCFLHKDTNPSMSYDYKRKRFHCFACGENYDIFDHYMQYRGLNFIEACKSINQDFGLNIAINEVKKERKAGIMIQPVSHSKVNEQGIKYLEERGLSLGTIEYLGVRQEKENIVFIYCNELGEHIANKYRVVGKVESARPKTWFQKYTNRNTLFNMDKINIDKELVICEGEIDCMSLIEAGYRNVVSIPTGCQSEEWIDVNWDWLIQFKEITVWFDNDEPGKKGARNVVNRLPNECVKLVDSSIANDINEILCKYGKQTVIEELRKAKELEIEGIIHMSNIEDFNVYEAEKIKSGIALLDRHIQGFVMGSLSVLTGYNGCGKSTLANQMIIGESIAQGYKVFVFSGELTAANFRYWLYTTLANKQDMVECKTKDGVSYLKLKEHSKQELTEWIDDKLFLYDKLDYSEEEILKMMELLAKRKGVRVFLLDNLMKVSLANGSHNELNAQKNFTNKLKQFAVKYNALVHLCCHPRKPQAGQMILNKFEISGSGDITNLADYIIGIHRVTQAEKKEYQDYQEIIQNGGRWNKEPILDPRDAKLYLFKDRPTGIADKEAGLYFDSQQKRFYLNEKELNKDYGYRVTYSQEKLKCNEVKSKIVDEWISER